LVNCSEDNQRRQKTNVDVRRVEKLSVKWLITGSGNVRTAGLVLSCWSWTIYSLSQSSHCRRQYQLLHCNTGLENYLL